MALQIKHEQLHPSPLAMMHKANGSPLSVAAWSPSSGSYVDLLQSMESVVVPSPKKSTTSTTPTATEGRGLWTADEHRGFIQGIKMFPSGPWKEIASHVGSRTARQTMTHAQKYRQKIARRLRNARANAQQPLPYNLDASCPRYNALLTNDEQFNDSILSTSLAIAAEEELDLMDDLIGPTSSSCDLQISDVYQPLSPTADIGFETTTYLMGSPVFDDCDLAFEECIDFLIAKFHQDQLP